MQAAVYVVGPEAPANVLKEAVRQLGFKSVHGYRGVREVELAVRETPLVFLLFTAVAQLRKLAPVIKEVRSSRLDRVRFAPLIYFADNPSLETIKASIGMGFDDIITLPFTLKRVADRLASHVDRRLAYYETDSYFGPDRRGRISDGTVHDKRGTGGAHRRIEIMRSVANGAVVVNDDLQIIV